MATFGESSSGERRSWRDSSDSRNATESSRSLGPWAMVCVLAVLLIAFGIWLYVWFVWGVQRTYVVTIISDNTDILVPPILYGEDNVSRLADHTNLERVDFEGLLEVGQIQSLQNQLMQIKFRGDDSLIVYVAAHGVAYGDEPYLLLPSSESAAGAVPVSPATQENGPAPPTFAYPVADLLAQIDQCRVSAKVVVLDAGHLSYDPRLGIVGNTFADALAKKVSQLKDLNVWVLASHAPGQVSNVRYAGGVSVFGQAVVDALAGDADGIYQANGNSSVTLRELYDFVAQQTGHETSNLQTPLVMRTGQTIEELERRASSLEGVRLSIVIRPRQSASDTADDAEAETSEGTEGEEDPPADSAEDATEARRDTIDPQRRAA